MMQRWSADTIRFMCDASEYGDYNLQLAQHILPYLPREGHVCDAGCGLGYLSLTLAPFCTRVTAVDLSEAALSVLRTKELPNNLELRQGDIFRMQAQYDAMIFCYFGKTEQILQLAAQQCRGKILVVKRNSPEHRFSMGCVKREKHGVDSLCEVLQQRGIDYISEALSLELGQPFRSLEDAQRFFELYNKSELSVQPETVRARLISTEHPRFPWYYPSRRNMELIVFESEALRA